MSARLMVLLMDWSLIKLTQEWNSTDPSFKPLIIQEWSYDTQTNSYTLLAVIWHINPTTISWELFRCQAIGPCSSEKIPVYLCQAYFTKQKFKGKPVTYLSIRSGPALPLRTVTKQPLAGLALAVMRSLVTLAEALFRSGEEKPKWTRFERNGKKWRKEKSYNILRSFVQ